jgi:quercetin dioxygenase-like cupin family protein
MAHGVGKEGKMKSKDSEKIAAKVLTSCDLIDYQEAAIVSREILKGKNGSVTAFAFDAGEGIKEHKTPFDALVHVIEGEAEITIGGKPSRLKSGEMILMPADIPHAVKAVTQFKMLLIMIK